MRLRIAILLCFALIALASGCRPSQTNDRIPRSDPPAPPMTRAEIADMRAELASLHEDLEEKPDDIGLLLRLGELATRAGNYDNAEIAYMRAISLEPENTAAYNQLGLHYITRKRPEAALSSFAKALKIDPDNVDAHYYLGNLALLSHELSTATKHYSRVLEIDPNHTFALKKLVMIRKAAASQLSMMPAPEEDVETES